jgi:hypothetical protein
VKVKQHNMDMLWPCCAATHTPHMPWLHVKKQQNVACGDQRQKRVNISEEDKKLYAVHNVDCDCHLAAAYTQQVQKPSLSPFVVPNPK